MRMSLLLFPSNLAIWLAAALVVMINGNPLMVSAIGACPALQFTHNVSHSDAGLTFTFQPLDGEPTPVWVVAHMTKDYPTPNPSVNLEISSSANFSSPGGSYNPDTRTFQWFVAPSVLLWMISDVPAYSFSYAVNKDGTTTTCDTDVLTPSDWFHVSGACPSIPYTQTLNYSSNTVSVTFKGNVGFQQPEFVDFHLGKNCNSSSSISSYSNLHAQDIGASSGCGYDPNLKTWYCNIPSQFLDLYANDEPCVQTTYRVAGIDCPSTVNYPGFAYVWLTGTWSQCSATCGGGVQTQRVWCQGNDGSPDLTGYSCDLASKPPTSRACNTQLCPVWVNDTWSACSTTCGGGTQTRAWRCMDPNTGSQMASASSCPQPHGPSSQACSTKPCPGWNPSQWSLCSISCGSGVQTRDVLCIFQDGTVDKSGGSCASLPKPVTSQACSGEACPHTNSSSSTGSGGGGGGTGIDVKNRNSTLSGGANSISRSNPIILSIFALILSAALYNL